MAVSCSVTSIKIDITSTGGVEETFGTVVTAVNAVSAGTITGSGTSGDPYIVVGDRALEISSGCKVRFEQNTNLKWNSITTSGRSAFYFASGCEVEIEDGCLFDCYASSAANVYNSFYGIVNVTGTSGNRTIFRGMSRNYMYFNTGDVTWTYFDLIDNRISGGHSMYFSQSSAYIGPQMNFSNFNINNATGSSGYAYGIYLTPGGLYANVSFDNFVIDECSYGAYIAGCSGKITNGTISNCLNSGVLVYGGGNVVSAGYDTSKDDTTFPTGRFQSMAVLENITFTDNDAGVYQVLAYSNSLLQIKDCTFNNSTYGIYSHTASVVLEYNNTYNSVTNPRLWGTNGTFLHTRKADFCVTNSSLTPIENATITVVQSENHERWAGVTDANGCLLNVFDGSPIFVEKEESSASTYDQWSDSIAGGRYHILTVSAPGYLLHEENFELTEDKTFDIVLETGHQILESSGFKHITHKKIKGV